MYEICKISDLIIVRLPEARLISSKSPSLGFRDESTSREYLIYPSIFLPK